MFHSAQRTHPASRRAVAIWLAATASICGVIVGGAAVVDYQTTPGECGAAPDRWPVASQLPRSPGTATLVMFVHPRCPCTRASFSELETALRRLHASVRVCFAFIRPPGEGEEWEREAVAEAGRRFPSAVAYVDVDGVEATRFGAATSGHVVLCDEEGRVVYAGGITGARDHVGDNSGRRALLTALDDPSDEARRGVVYGCALLGPASRPAICAPPKAE